jgi:hypothetical protein
MRERRCTGGVPSGVKTKVAIAGFEVVESFKLEQGEVEQRIVFVVWVHVLLGYSPCENFIGFTRINALAKFLAGLTHDLYLFLQFEREGDLGGTRAVLPAVEVVGTGEEGVGTDQKGCPSDLPAFELHLQKSHAAVGVFIPLRHRTVVSQRSCVLFHGFAVDEHSGIAGVAEQAFDVELEARLPECFESFVVDVGKGVALSALFETSLDGPDALGHGFVEHYLLL